MKCVWKNAKTIRMVLRFAQNISNDIINSQLNEFYGPSHLCGIFCCGTKFQSNNWLRNDRLFHSKQQLMVINLSIIKNEIGISLINLSPFYSVLSQQMCCCSYSCNSKSISTPLCSNVIYNISFCLRRTSSTDDNHPRRTTDDNYWVLDKLFYWKSNKTQLWMCSVSILFYHILIIFYSWEFRFFFIRISYMFSAGLTIVAFLRSNWKCVFVLL